MAASRLVVFGDSVNWGQGLLTQHKFSTLVGGSLGANGATLTVEMMAHSGATIGVRGPATTTKIDGEVPVSYPTVWEQVTTYPHDPAEAAVIVVNGGINDIDIRVILNPLTTESDLRQDIRQFCHDDMLTLLREVVRRFPTTAPIIVTSYYPILSPRSHPFRIPFLLQTFGVGMPFFVDQNLVFKKIVALCMQFWSESGVELQRAVQDCNAVEPGARVKFAAVPFGADNAVFADHPWLFGLDGEFDPQDEVIPQRRAACNLNIDPFDIFGREGCYRASAGHPNAEGAVKYAEAVAAMV